MFDEVQARTRDLSESLQQQTATADVLKVISRSTFDLQPILDTLTESAARLCEADIAAIIRQKGDANYWATSYGLSAEQSEYVKKVRIVPGRGTVAGRVLQEGKTVHVPDILTDPEYVALDAQKIAGHRATLGVPLLREGSPIGVVLLMRRAARAFTKKQIELVETFADQAVIAIENVRLFDEVQARTRELSESLEQQTATSEVLKVISSSPGELEPVFETMLANAVRVCGAKFGAMQLYNEGTFRTVAMHNVPPAFAELRRANPIVRPSPRTGLGRVASTKQVVQIPDLTKEQTYREREPVSVAMVELAGGRTLLVVPMLKENVLVGTIAIYRQEVHPFTDKQIELVQNFAAQAVIAIENTRLLNELRESLQQQTATSEVLKVISSSPGELEPVFNAMLANATRICEATFGRLWLFEGNAFRAVAIHSTQTFADYQRRNPVLELRDHPGIPLDRIAKTKQVVHIPDFRADQSYIGKDSAIVTLVETEGTRSFVAVPMLKEGELIGAIAIYRQEMRPFTDKQIELLTNFAAQAVIAIENTRLLNELRKSLQQQTATADVLKVISSSPGDLGPVFEAMLANAVRICEANFGVLFRSQGAEFYPAAWAGVPPEYEEFLRRRGQFRPTDGAPLDRLLKTKQLVFTVDELAERHPGPAAEFGGARSLIAVPMFKDGELVGAIVIYRQEVRPFNDRQVALVSNFASQAVIAIENTRLLNELRESLQQQTATADVLKVISRSTFDLETVLDTLTASAAQLCQADKGAIFEKDGDVYRLAAHFGFSPEEERQAKQYAREHPLGPGRGSVVGRVAMGGRAVHIRDVLADPEYQASVYQKAFGFRSNLGVPLLREGAVIGVFALMRMEVNSFTEKEIELVSMFADQAVIAIENTRLLNELRESLQQQTATADVLKVISRSTFDLQTVLDTLLEVSSQFVPCRSGCDETIARRRLSYSRDPWLFASTC